MEKTMKILNAACQLVHTETNSSLRKRDTRKRSQFEIRYTFSAHFYLRDRPVLD